MIWFPHQHDSSHSPALTGGRVDGLLCYRCRNLFGQFARYGTGGLRRSSTQPKKLVMTSRCPSNTHTNTQTKPTTNNDLTRKNSTTALQHEKFEAFGSAGNEEQYHTILLLLMFLNCCSHIYASPKNDST